MTLLIDNYDSFTYNLYQYIGSINPNITTVRNDELRIEDIATLAPDRIVISPGPGAPRDAGCIEAVVRTYAISVPILGVCLGHQAICEAFGARIVHAKTLMHGKTSTVAINNHVPIFADLPGEIEVARYHSLAVDEQTLPAQLQVCARAQDGEVMAVAHVSQPVYGVQFHPESIMTPCGMQILKNFMKLRGTMAPTADMQMPQAPVQQTRT